MFVGGECPEENRDRLTSSLFEDFLYITICKYSLGYKLNEVKSSLDECANWYVKTNGKLIERISHETYYQHLMLFSLAILLEVDDIAFRSITDKWGEYEIGDALIEGFIKARFPKYRSNSSLFMPQVYGELNELLISDFDLNTLKKYLKSWYSLHKDCHWYNSHKAKGPAYFGHWSFEAAAVAKIRSLDVSNQKLGAYFPYDLVGAVAKRARGAELEEPVKTVHINYPGLEKLSFSVDPLVFENESKDRLSLITKDSKLEIAGTVFQKNGKQLAEFAAAKTTGILEQMPWYQQVGEWTITDSVKFKSLQSAYQGVWPKEDEPTFYSVVVIDIGDYLVSLTFTCLASDLSAYSSMIDDFLSSLSYQK